MKGHGILQTYGEARFVDFARIGPMPPFDFEGTFMRSSSDAIVANIQGIGTSEYGPEKLTRKQLYTSYRTGCSGGQLRREAK